MNSTPDQQVPCSPTTSVDGVLYFPRMTAKIRLFAQGTLRSDLHDNLGKGMDGWLCDFLRVPYAELRDRTLTGEKDEDLLQWCQRQSRPLNATDKLVWNLFVQKFGWNDQATPILERRKKESGLEHRADIQTIAHYIDADEGRA